MAGVVCVVVPRLRIGSAPCAVLLPLALLCFPFVLCVVGGGVWWCVLVNGGVCVVSV